MNTPHLDALLRRTHADYMSIDQCHAAAAALGSFAAVQIRVLEQLPEVPEHNHYRRERNAEQERIIIQLVIEAAHYAHRAEDEINRLCEFLCPEVAGYFSGDEQ